MRVVRSKNLKEDKASTNYLKTTGISKFKYLWTSIICSSSNNIFIREVCPVDDDTDMIRLLIANASVSYFGKRLFTMEKSSIVKFLYCVVKYLSICIIL